jgi:flagellar biosynthesis protein FlhF
MQIKTYRARSMQEALARVRRELGPDAAVLHTREVGGGIWRWLGGGRQIEVTAAAGVNVPSRITDPADKPIGPPAGRDAAARNQAAFPANRAASTPPDRAPSAAVPPADELDYRAKFRHDLNEWNEGSHDLASLVEDLCQRSRRSALGELPEALFRLYTDLIDAEVAEPLARELVERVRAGAGNDADDALLMKARIARLVEDEIEVRGPLSLVPGERRLVALVGPTGVGKTTTIAKLAANFRLRDRRRVGLITVDTYRIAAVDQLRTYADIIDLPMEVVSTPREMREASARLAGMDLVLMDTAGRSPRDDVKIHELKTMLAESQADEVHLVLSSVGSAASLANTAANFAEVGTTALILTKLDETTGLGNLLPLLRSCKLPLSYLTNGQNVPDDIEPADRRKLARTVLGMESRNS